MSREISAGAVVVRRGQTTGEIKFLLLYHGRNYWSFPKGHVEPGEKATTAFLREVAEETGLHRHDLKIIPDFRATERYVFRETASRRRGQVVRTPRHPGATVFKIVIFYLVETRKREVVVSDEHSGYAWFTYPEALRIAKYPGTRDILKQAYEFIRKGVRRRAAHPPRQGRHVR